MLFRSRTCQLREFLIRDLRVYAGQPGVAKDADRYEPLDSGRTIRWTGGRELSLST